MQRKFIFVASGKVQPRLPSSLVVEMKNAKFQLDRTKTLVCELYVFENLTIDCPLFKKP